MPIASAAGVQPEPRTTATSCGPVWSVRRAALVAAAAYGSSVTRAIMAHNGPGWETKIAGCHHGPFGRRIKAAVIRYNVSWWMNRLRPKQPWWPET